jgi:NADPH:quinone reductase-like Zn-dependent oxidoreductase
MKAAIVTAGGKSPVFGEFNEPMPSEAMEVVTVSASALSQFSKIALFGTHYSSDGPFPAVAGADGVGLTADGLRVYFVLPEAPNGALAEKCLVDSSHCVEVSDGLDDATTAARANPGMSAWAALVQRSRLQPGETVLINGATGSAGCRAVQLAKYLGAGKVIATGRNEAELQQLPSLGADAVIAFNLSALRPSGAKDYERALKEVFAQGVNVVVSIRSVHCPPPKD